MRKEITPVECKIICVEKKPNIGKKIFFGEYDHYIRVDYVSHEIAKRLKEHAEANTWFTKELNFTQDIQNIHKLDKIALRIFQYNIAYQNLMDSGVSNSFSNILAPLCSQPIWQLLYMRIGYEETIHAESYSYALHLIFNEKAEQILDLVYYDSFVQKRLEHEVDTFEDVYKYVLLGKNKDDKAKQLILEALLRTYFLEGVKFPFSFFTAWIINENYDNAIQGISRMLKLIAYDELTTHVPTGYSIMNILRDEEEQEFSHLFVNGWFEETALKIAKQVMDEEIAWSNYLLKDGEIPNYTREINEHFIKYQVQDKLRKIKVDYTKLGLNEKRSDIIEWFDNYRDLNKSNTALQEADNLTYQKSTLQNDLNKFDEFEF
jgi:ribonucleoside-diphosphate reductase beta chain